MAPEEEPPRAAAGRLRVYLDPGRPGASSIIAELEIEALSRDRVPGWLPPLSGRQLAGASCVVCGSPLGMDTVRIGTVRQILAGGKALTYPVRGCTVPCRHPLRAPRPQLLGQLGWRPTGSPPSSF